MTKAEKTSLYYEHQGFIRLIVSYFLQRYKTYVFMYDDLVAECAMRFVTICDKFDPSRDVKFTTFLHSQLMYYLRNAMSAEVRCQVAEETWVATTEFNEVYDPYAFEELLRGGTLTENQKEVLRLRYIMDMTYQEIADEMGVSRPAIFYSENRALETLRRDLG